MSGQNGDEWKERLLAMGLPVAEAERITDPGDLEPIGFVAHDAASRGGRPRNVMDGEKLRKLAEVEELTYQQICDRTGLWNGKSSRWQHPSPAGLCRKLTEMAHAEAASEGLRSA